MDRRHPMTAPRNLGALVDRGPDDWQVLQRQADGTASVALSGTWSEDGPATDPVVKARVVREDNGEPVVPWTAARMAGSGSAPSWSVRLRVPAGGPYRIETCLATAEQVAVEWSRRGDMIRHVCIGDVYAIAGQSNSAGYGKDPVSDPPELGIHLLANDGRWRLASHPLNESTGTVHPANREGANPGHSPWLAFARRLRADLHVPVGLVQASLGGSPLSAWNPEEDGTLYRNLMDILAAMDPEAGSPDASDAPAGDASASRPRLLAGVLWYQGCSDTGEGACDTYLDRFGRLVAHLREDLGDLALPMATVQIGRLTTPADEAADVRWAKVREAQRQAARTIPGVVVVPAIDLPLSDQIHIAAAGNTVLGERVARAVLGAFHGIAGDDFRAPEPASAVREGPRTVRVRFDHVPERLFHFGLAPELCPWVVETPDGRVLVPSSTDVPDREGAVLTFGEDLPAGCRLHGAHRQNCYPAVPFDISTRLPMLSFYGFPVD